MATWFPVSLLEAVKTSDWEPRPSANFSNIYLLCGFIWRADVTCGVNSGLLLSIFSTRFGLAEVVGGIISGLISVTSTLVALIRVDFRRRQQEVQLPIVF
jgi:hypothetical protein